MVIKGYETTDNPITFYNPYNPVAHRYFFHVRNSMQQNNNLYIYVSRET